VTVLGGYRLSWYVLRSPRRTVGLVINSSLPIDVAYCQWAGGVQFAAGVDSSLDFTASLDNANLYLRLCFFSTKQQ